MANRVLSHFKTAQEGPKDDRQGEAKHSFYFKKHAWTPDEDSILLQKVKEMGERRWRQIAQFIPNRSGKQCRERYVNHLAEGVNKQPWTENEEWVLFLCSMIYQSKWARIGLYLPGRTDNGIKNHWHSKMRKKLIRMENRLESQLSKQTDANEVDEEKVVGKLLTEATNNLSAHRMKTNYFFSLKEEQPTHQSENVNVDPCKRLQEELTAYLREFGTPSTDYEHSEDMLFLKEVLIPDNLPVQLRTPKKLVRPDKP